MIASLPPGTILQLMYLRERINTTFGDQKIKFIEVGSGSGYLSHFLLSLGNTGIAYELNPNSCAENNILNESYIKNHKFQIINSNFLTESGNHGITESGKFDLLISSMVIEHLEESDVLKLFNRARSLIQEKGVIVTLVPSNKNYWGIEDEIAGHLRRYNEQEINKLSKLLNMDIRNITGLTFPVSNLLFPLSNYLIKKQESYKKAYSNQEKTILSGNRNVYMKTQFPKFLSIFLNEK